MNVLMCEIPTTERDGSVPFGVLYAASSVYRAGHNVRIIDLVKDPLKYPELKTIIDEFKPDLIGMGGITSSYWLCKELVRNIKQDFPAVPIVAGGVLSSVADLLIERAGVDYVVHGEGEETLVRLIASIESGLSPDTVNGISF
ncbi:MAG: cobalamin-dependent protein, partial [Candidatus Omnitrophota bacterium]